MVLKIKIILTCLCLVAALGRCSNRTSKSSSANGGKTIYMASKEKSTPEKSEKGTTRPASPSPEDIALMELVEENMKKSDFVPLGPACPVAPSNQFTTAAERFLQGQGQCYVVIASCDKNTGKIEIRLTGDQNSAAASKAYKESDLDPEKITALLACPEKDGMYKVQLKSEISGMRCAAGLLGN